MYLSVRQHGGILEVHAILLYRQRASGSYIRILLQPHSLSSDETARAVRGGFNVLIAWLHLGLHEYFSFSIRSTFTIPSFVNHSSPGPSGLIRRLLILFTFHPSRIVYFFQNFPMIPIPIAFLNGAELGEAKFVTTSRVELFSASPCLLYHARCDTLSMPVFELLQLSQ